jgi:hypothetical protein
VLSVQELGGLHRDEELGAVGVGARVGHRQQTGLVEAQLRVELVLELVPGAAPAGSRRVTALDHETVDHTVEDRVVVELGLARLRVLRALALGQLHEVGDGQRGVGGEELHLDVALAGVERGAVDVGNLHLR